VPELSVAALHYLDRHQIVAHLLAHRTGNDDPPDSGNLPPSGPGDDLPPSGPSDDQATHAGVVGASHPTSTGDDQRIGIEVRVALSTLLGHDEQPGEIPGLGPVPASHARAVVARQHRAEWRYAITDDIGRLLFDGVTRRRPTGRTTTGPPGGIVELHMPAALLATLTNSGDGAGPVVARWAGLLADLAPLCRHDHTLKGQAGWTLRQPSPGTFPTSTGFAHPVDARPTPVAAGRRRRTHRPRHATTVLNTELSRRRNRRSRARRRSASTDRG
jgi:hypothetical protein